VSQEFFNVMATPPQLGRTFAGEAEPLVVISDRL
jgi:hypothetical protein